MGSLKALVITPKYGGADAHTLGGWFLGLFLVFGPFLNSESQVSSSKAGEILRDSDGNINATTFCFLQWNKRSEARAWSFLWGRDSGKAPSCGCLLFSTGFPSLVPTHASSLAGSERPRHRKTWHCGKTRIKALGCCAAAVRGNARQVDQLDLEEMMLQFCLVFFWTWIRIRSL